MRSLVYKTKIQHRELRREQRSTPQGRMRTSFRLVLLGAVLFFGVGYLVLSNHVATKGFLMKDLQSQIDTLSQTNDALEVQVMDLQSLSNLQAASSELELVSISKMEYVSDTEPTFALRGEAR